MSVEAGRCVWGLAAGAAGGEWAEGRDCLGPRAPLAGTGVGGGRAWLDGLVQRGGGC